MTTATATTTDWATYEFAVITARSFPSINRPTYHTIGHDSAACSNIGNGENLATGSLVDFVTANEGFDGEIDYMDPWPCKACVPVSTGIPIMAEFEARRDLPTQGTTSQRTTVAADPVADQTLAEAKAYAVTYTGTFPFMLDMRGRANKGFTLTPKMVAAILRCKAADKGTVPAATTDEDARRLTLARNAFPGICRVCQTDVIAGAGRRERVGGIWTVVHNSTAECAAKITPTAPQTPKVATPDVPAGKYAITSDEGHLSFYSVRTPDQGKWAGYVFVDLLIGSPVDWRHQSVPRSQRFAVLAKIAADPQGAAARYGHEFQQCGTCSAPLSLKRSRDAGYGQVCAAKRGWAW